MRRQRAKAGRGAGFGGVGELTQPPSNVSKFLVFSFRNMTRGF